MVKFFNLLGFIILLEFCSCNSTNKHLYRIIENGLYGFIDSTGAVVIAPQYKYVSKFNEYDYATVITEYSLKIGKDKLGITDTLLHIKYGFIDKQNNLVVDTVHTMDLSQNKLVELDIAPNYKTFVNKFSNGELKFNACIDGDFIQLRANLYAVQNPKTKLMGYMNIVGDTTITAKYNICNPFYEGTAIASLARESFSTVESFLESLNSTILIDSLGRELMKEKYYSIQNFSGTGYTWASKLEIDESYNTNFIWMLLDKKGKVCSDTVHCSFVYNTDSDIYVWQYMVFDTPFYSFVNNKGEFLTDFNHDGSISFSNETYTDVTSFSDSIAGVKVQYEEEPCWTFVNRKFEFISQPFDSVGRFNEGLAAAKEFSEDKESSKWGFVDKQFKNIIPYKYDKVSMFSHGLAYFQIQNTEGYINKKGEVVWCHTKR